MHQNRKTPVYQNLRSISIHLHSAWRTVIKERVQSVVDPDIRTCRPVSHDYFLRWRGWPKSIASGRNLRPSLGGRENFSPTKMTFFSEKISILAAKIAHIRQHYFSKYWGDECMGRPPPQTLHRFPPLSIAKLYVGGMAGLSLWIRHFVQWPHNDGGTSRRHDNKNTTRPGS